MDPGRGGGLRNFIQPWSYLLELDEFSDGAVADGKVGEQMEGLVSTKVNKKACGFSFRTCP